MCWRTYARTHWIRTLWKENIHAHMCGSVCVHKSSVWTCQEIYRCISTRPKSFDKIVWQNVLDIISKLMIGIAFETLEFIQRYFKMYHSKKINNKTTLVFEFTFVIFDLILERNELLTVSSILEIYNQRMAFTERSIYQKEGGSYAWNESVWTRIHPTDIRESLLIFVEATLTQ